MEKRILLYFTYPPLKDPFFFGDRFLKQLRDYIFKKKNILEMVFLNLHKELDQDLTKTVSLRRNGQDKPLQTLSISNSITKIESHFY